MLLFQLQKKVIVAPIATSTATSEKMLTPANEEEFKPEIFDIADNLEDEPPVLEL
jgi:hypothetical protein